MLFNRSMSLLQYVSDLHLEKGFKRTIYAQKPYLLLGGDIGYPSYADYKMFLYEMSYNFDKVFILAGNHEYDLSKNVIETDMEIIDICNSKNNLCFLQKDINCLDKENNIYIAGCTLWSKLPKSKFVHHLNHVEWLNKTISENKDKNFIIATHHCPSIECLNKYFHNFVPNYFASDQSKILNYNNVVTWIHGHSHINKNFQYNNKWILSNQYGSHQYPLSGYKN